MAYDVRHNPLAGIRCFLTVDKIEWRTAADELSQSPGGDSLFSDTGDVAPGWTFVGESQSPGGDSLFSDRTARLDLDGHLCVTIPWRGFVVF